MVQKTSARGRALIRQFEGCKLLAYRCPAGIWTIGVGHTGPDVQPGMRITEKRADELLELDLAKFERAVTQLVGAASQEHFDAMVSLCFNIGIKSFSKSSVVRWHNRGDEEKAAYAFGLWNKARVDGKLTVLQGLVRRRAAEASMYVEGDFADVSPKRPVEMVPLSTKQIELGLESVPESAMKPEQPGGLVDMAQSGRVVRAAIGAPAVGTVAAGALADQDATSVSQAAADSLSQTTDMLNQAEAAKAKLDPAIVSEHLNRTRELVEAKANVAHSWHFWTAIAVALLVGIFAHAFYSAWTSRTGRR